MPRLPATLESDPYYVGNVQWLNVNGTRKMLARWVRDEMKLTELGREYYSRYGVDYIIHVPVVTTYKRRNGTLWEAPESTIPIEWERAPQEEGAPRFREQMIAHVRSKLPEDFTTVSIHSVRVLYNKDPKEWALSRREVKVEGRRADVDVRLDMPLGSPDGRHSFTARPESVVDAAHQPSENCVLSQLAPHLGITEDRLLGYLTEAANELYPANRQGWPFGHANRGWRLKWGVTPRQIAYVCRVLGRSCHAFADDVKVLSSKTERKGGRQLSVTFSFGNGHFWLFEPSAANSLTHKNNEDYKVQRLMHELTEPKPREEVDIAEWRDDAIRGAPPRGIFATTDPGELLHVRKCLLEIRRCPRMQWADTMTPSKLTYYFTKEEGGGKFELCGLPPEYHTLRAASASLQREYRLQGMAGWMHAMVRAELKGSRGYLLKRQKEALLAKQGQRCAKCGVGFSAELEPEYDHIEPYACGGTEMQALCRPCHLEKNVNEWDLTRAGMALESHLNDQAWQALVEQGVNAVLLQAEKPPMHSLQYLDKERCRTSILKGDKCGAFHLPVAIPQDQIEPYVPGSEDGLNGFFYVDVEVPSTPQEALALLPIRGRGWHFVASVHYALSREIISRAQITWQFLPSASLKWDRFNTALERVLRELPDEDQVFGDRLERNLRKEACNKLVGLWGRREHWCFRSTCSETAQDGDMRPIIGETVRRPVGVGAWTDFFFKEKLFGRHTHYLLHRAVLDIEGVLMAAAVERVQSIGGTVYEINTDSVLYAGEAIAEEGWRCYLTDGHRLQGERSLLVRDDPEVPAPAPWTDLDREAAMAHCLNGGSLAIEAQAGTGKTTFLREVIRELRAKGRKVQACATTHVATANLHDPTAMTLARLTHHYGAGRKNTFDVLVIDEFSCVHTLVWSWLATAIEHCKAQVICAGDWHQLPPVGDSRNALQCPSMRDRAFFRQLCGSTRLRLTECRRSDARLFDFYSRIPDSPLSVPGLVKLARNAFPVIEGVAPVNLVTSHDLRVRLNGELMEVYKPTDRECFWTQPGPSKVRNNLPQAMWLWKGQKVICASTGHHFRNRWPYVITELNEKTAVLEAEGLGDKTSAMPHALVAEKFRPAWAITYHASQGLTFDCRVRLWGWSHTAIYTKEHLLVGMSRCTRGELLDFGPV